MIKNILKKENVKSFFKENYGFFASAVAIIAAYLIAQYIFDIYPMGKAIMASYDLLAQISPFLEHYFSFLDGTSGLFHSFFVGGGMDTFGILAYCTISPFTFLFLLAGKTHSLFMVSVVLPLKTVCASFSALYMLKKHFGKIPHYFSTVLAVLYALSGYLYVSNTYINWVDLMIYMPIVLSGFIEFSKNGKKRKLAVSLALLIYTCFSLASFSFFILFPLGVIYILLCKEKSERKRFLTSFSLAFALAVCIALPLLIPCLGAYLKAGRNTGIFSKVFTSDITDTQHLYEKFAYVLCDSAFIFLTVVYFIRNAKKDALAKFLYVALSIILLPCLVDESMLLLNFGSYYSYALRFGFINEILLLFIAARSSEDILTAPDQSEKKAKNAIFLSVLVILAGLGAGGAFALFRHILHGKFEEGQPFYSYFAAFAHSEGGLEGTSVLFGIFTLIAIVGAVFAKFKLISRKNTAMVLSVVALFCSGFNLFAMVKGDRQGGSYEKIVTYTNLAAAANDLNGSRNYRLKSYDYYISANNPEMSGYLSTGVFNSMTDSKNLTLASLFKYGGNGTNSSRSNKGGVFGDALFGYKYVVFSKNDVSKASTIKYLTETEIVKSGYKIYENPLAFPLAAVTSGKAPNFDGLNGVEKIDSIYKFLSGGESGLTEITPVYTENESGTLKINYSAKANCEYWYWNKFPKELDVVRVSGDKTYELPEYTACGYTANAANRSIELKKQSGEKLTKEEVEPYFHVSYMSIAAIEKLSASLKEKAVDFTLVKNGVAFKDKISAKKGDKLYLSFVNIDGYSATVNGQRRELSKNDANLIILDLDEGENEVRITYRSPYYKYILIGTLLSVFMIVALYLSFKKFTKIGEVLSKPIAVAAVILAAALILFFFVFPMGICVYKLIKLIL